MVANALCMHHRPSVFSSLQNKLISQELVFRELEIIAIFSGT